MGRKAYAVIGANWGDEGKGKMVDFLANSQPNPMVVRFNGGAQAGHTVERGGVRHVFSHFGAGTLTGADTYLSPYFICNPKLFLSERKALQEKGVHVPMPSVDWRCQVTTHIDMMINQEIEAARGEARHGSCGVGINETMRRSGAGFDLVVDDLFFHQRLHDKLLRIRREWLPYRLHELNLDGIDLHPRMAGMLDDANLWQFEDQAAQFTCYIEPADAIWDDDSLNDSTVIFEGAQGLLLDQDHHFFPHVTHSHTGLHNVMRLSKIMGIKELQVIYMTRTYMTRHGAGPFPSEIAGMSYFDATNKPNKHQGSLRFGILDLDLLRDTIRADIARHAPMANGLSFSLGITYGDLIDDLWDYQAGGKIKTVIGRQAFIDAVAEYVGIPVSFVSIGPGADQMSAIVD